MKRGERVPRPPERGYYDVRFGDNKAAKMWPEIESQLGEKALRKIWDRLSADPRLVQNPARHHRLKGALGTGHQAGRQLEQWQYELTSGGRLWLLVDDEKKIVWIVMATLAPPSQTH